MFAELPDDLLSPDLSSSAGGPSASEPHTTGSSSLQKWRHRGTAGTGLSLARKLGPDSQPSALLGASGVPAADSGEVGTLCWGLSSKVLELPYC